MVNLPKPKREHKCICIDRELDDDEMIEQIRSRARQRIRERILAIISLSEEQVSKCVTL